MEESGAPQHIEGGVVVDHVELAADLPVPLTSVRSDRDRMGRLALELLDRIAGRDVSSILLPPVLVPRASTLRTGSTA
ncbi:substrate-binding domain-containing protein [Arthrobacter gengyunqii]|uniref:Substrate-binding domain-containing protein n=1 Tax=Arthrobacter gengyunqii TaxID=2886940 RepID=A0ABS8GLU3_9MICC|nr:substrate-binding domain-containing protein [Arthrobacter gengyunqii]MCC3266957.1 substrate-binding domain-containing protein [Arthrobacter gengyunqii]